MRSATGCEPGDAALLEVGEGCDRVTTGPGRHVGRVRERSVRHVVHVDRAELLRGRGSGDGQCEQTGKCQPDELAHGAVLRLGLPGRWAPLADKVGRCA